MVNAKLTSWPLRLITLSLLALYPISWFAPLMRAGLLPLFGLEEISVITGIVSLLDTDIFLAIFVAIFALIAPLAKTIWLIGLQWDLLPKNGNRLLYLLGRISTADIFLIALYISISNGIGVGTIQVAWGLYLFSGCILVSLLVGFWMEDE